MISYSCTTSYLIYVCHRKRHFIEKRSSRPLFIGAYGVAKIQMQYVKTVPEKIMRKRLSGLKSFHWRLWISLCALALIPAVYQTVKTFLISAGGQAGVFDIIGQME